MKLIFRLFLFCLLLIGCKNENQLTFESLKFTNDTCEDCPTISIDIPNSLDNSKIDVSINSALREELISLLNFDEEIDVTTIEEAITSFNKGYFDFKKMFPDENTEWEAEINGEVTYENKNIISIQIQSYMFTGGAHGYNSVQFLNFNKKNGDELENWELFKDSSHFIKFAESKFRIQESIPQDDPINSTGFMFVNEAFHLPEHIGFTKEGLLLRYNQYEVASYADGPILLTLPYNEVKNYLSLKIKF
ncbi:MAG: hypothetical protein COA50_09210 [Flavobacteriaceae bacterium]|nr:MAG: hypothetical protein COA50_09210 [Flavobacteriaceae bacterium]